MSSTTVARLTRTLRVDQFGTSGCVGCGRCIAWRPAAIDITQEAVAIATAPGGGTC